jgi:hypothetical protein
MTMAAQQAAMVGTEMEVSDLVARARQATRADLIQLEASVAVQVLSGAADPEGAGLPLRYGDRTVFARPLNTRRFVLAMARHLCFN